MITYPILFFSSGGIIMYDGFNAYVIGDFIDQDAVHKYDYFFWNPNQPFADMSDEAQEAIYFNSEIREILTRIDFADHGSAGFIGLNKATVYPVFLDTTFLFQDSSNTLPGLQKARFYPVVFDTTFDFSDKANGSVGPFKSRYYFAFPKYLDLDAAAKSINALKLRYYTSFPDFSVVDDVDKSISAAKLQYYRKAVRQFKEEYTNNDISFIKGRYYNLRNMDSNNNVAESAAYIRGASWLSFANIFPHHQDNAMTSISLSASYEPAVQVEFSDSDHGFVRTRIFGTAT